MRISLVHASDILPKGTETCSVLCFPGKSSHGHKPASLSAGDAMTGSRNASQSCSGAFLLQSLECSDLSFPDFFAASARDAAWVVPRRLILWEGREWVVRRWQGEWHFLPAWCWKPSALLGQQWGRFGVRSWVSQVLRGGNMQGTFCHTPGHFSWLLLFLSLSHPDLGLGSWRFCKLPKTL